jgi:hypothetical protein
MKAKEALYGSKVKGFHVLSENPFPYNGFIRNRKSFLEGVFHFLSIASAEFPRKY